MGKLTVYALRTVLAMVLAMVLAGTVLVQAGMVHALAALPVRGSLLLAQAVARDVEAAQLQAELDEVI